MAEQPDSYSEEKKPVEAKADTNKKAQLSTFFAKKSGMTRIFDGEGNHVPVTVLSLVPNVIAQCKTTDVDGHTAYQVAYYEKRLKLISKGIQGHLKKAGVDKGFSRFAEVKIQSEPNADFVGQEVELSNFEPKSFVDITGISKGKGFQGVMKRYGFSGGPASHGSHFHRGPGSIGNRATPGRVFKEKKMPGHMGNERVTVQNIEIVEVNLDKGYMLVKGSVPGARNSFIRVSQSIKKLNRS